MRIPQYPEFRLQSFIPPDLHTQMPECGDQCGVGFHRVAVTICVLDLPNIKKLQCFRHLRLCFGTYFSKQKFVWC